MIARSATLDLTHAPAIWVDLMVVVGCGLWAVTVAVVVGCGAIGFGSRWRSGLGYGGDRFWVWVTVEIVFEIGFGF